MKNHTSFKIGGCAKFFIKVNTIDELKQGISFAQKLNLPYFILGNGTNLLVSDTGFAGVIIQLSNGFSFIQQKENIFEVGASTPLSKLARQTLKEGYSEIHKLAGIPGSLGGAIFMNAGAYGQEIGKCCIEVNFLDKDKILSLNRDECHFEYRQSIFSKQHPHHSSLVILSAKFQFFQKKPTDILQKELNDCMTKRKESQPLNFPNAGSIFKRLDKGSIEFPEQVSPGFYIEKAGLKGLRINGAEISHKHGNFIVNVDNATAKDVLTLCEIAEKEIFEKFGVKLHREIILLGDF